MLLKGRFPQMSWGVFASQTCCKEVLVFDDDVGILQTQARKHVCIACNMFVYVSLIVQDPVSCNTIIIPQVSTIMLAIQPP